MFRERETELAQTPRENLPRGGNAVDIVASWGAASSAPAPYSLEFGLRTMAVPLGGMRRDRLNGKSKNFMSRRDARHETVIRMTVLRRRWWVAFCELALVPVWIRQGHVAGGI